MRIKQAGSLFIFSSLVLAATVANCPAGGHHGNPCTPAADSEETPAAVKQSLANHDLPNFHKVHPFLYRSGEPSSKGLAQLKNMGIATVIDLRGNPERTFDEGRQVRSLGMKYINLPMSSQPPTRDQVRIFTKEVEEAASGKANGSVLVHCAHGSDRTGCMVGIWRVTHDHYSYEKAYQEMRKYYFTPKFTRLSGAVRQYAGKQLSQHASGAQ